jgi:hypothetical protein
LATGFLTAGLAAGFAAGFFAAGLAAGFATDFVGIAFALGFLEFDFPKNLSKIATYFLTPQSLDALKGLSNRPAHSLFCHDSSNSHFDGSVNQRVKTPLAS